jgi:hypothetical protein
MDEDEDFADEARDDYLYEQYGPQYADDHRAEIAQDAVTSGLYVAILEAHSDNYVAATAQLEKAKVRLGTGDWDEAVFHAGRALDGYTRAVFIEPFRERMLQPFHEAFPHVPVTDGSVIKSVTGLGNSSGFLYFGIAATADENDATALIKDLTKFLHDKAGGAWNARNQAAHSLHDPAEAEAQAFLDRVSDFLKRLAAPLEEGLARNAEMRRKAEEEVRASEAWRNG